MYIDRRGIERWQAVDRWIMKYWTAVYARGVDGRRLGQALPHIVGPRVLEVSFGLGYLLGRYAGKFEVTGVDINPRCIAIASARLQRLGLQARLVEGDVHALPFADASFETVVNTDAFLLYQDPELALSECMRVLAPGGRLIVLEYDDPTDGNVLGTLWALGARHVIRMPRFDSKGLFATTGLPYDDHPIGCFGAFHMFIVNKPVAQDVAQPVHQSA